MADPPVRSSRTAAVTAVPCFPSTDHDHDRCQSAILADAEQVCLARRVRLTAQRRRVLEIITESHGAIGAYDILDRLARDGRRPAPIAVYRALDFLIEHGLVHRLASLNAYVACAHAAARHGAQFLICQRCGMIGEITDPGVSRAIAEAASEIGFTVSSPVVEVAGLCAACRKTAIDATAG
jgi:Fur family transcriptional regulator, zinc uptake regulator